MIAAGNDEWKKFVPKKVAELISKSALFGYRNDWQTTSV
jgi:hypothetical protein